MNRQIWGIALFALGSLVIADGLLSFVQKNTGAIRWLYVGLGAVLVIRGLYVWRSFHKHKIER